MLSAIAASNDPATAEFVMSAALMLSIVVVLESARITFFSRWCDSHTSTTCLCGVFVTQFMARIVTEYACEVHRACTYSVHLAAMLA